MCGLLILEDDVLTQVAVAPAASSPFLAADSNPQSSPSFPAPPLHTDLLAPPPNTQELEGCQNTLIGDDLIGIKGISGGQKRRVSVGIELVKEPGILFLDEPTSGLDSEMAVSLMTLLVRLARKGKTVSDWMWRAWLHGCKCLKGRWGGLGPVESDRFYVGVSKGAVGEG